MSSTRQQEFSTYLGPQKNCCTKLSYKSVCQYRPKTMKPAEPVGQNCQKRTWKKPYGTFKIGLETGVRLSTAGLGLGMFGYVRLDKVVLWLFCKYSTSRNGLLFSQGPLKYTNARNACVPLRPLIKGGAKIYIVGMFWNLHKNCSLISSTQFLLFSTNKTIKRLYNNSKLLWEDN